MATRIGTYRLIGLLALLGLVFVTACSSARAPQPGATALGDDAITVASFDFPESRLLADLYATALRNGGYDVRAEHALGPRELVDPALARGLVELVPEYTGTALQFLSLGAAPASADSATAHAALRRTVRGSSLVALDPAPAQDANAIVVSPETAARYDLRTVSDLRAVAPKLTFGGPPECPSRPLCLQGLQERYGLRFRSFLPLDAGGPLTRAAIERGEVDVALMFTTAPMVGASDAVALADDRALQPAENVTPLVHRATVERFGPQLVDLVNRVSAALTTTELQILNARVDAGTPSATVAAQWLDSEGIG